MAKKGDNVKLHPLYHGIDKIFEQQGEPFHPYVYLSNDEKYTIQQIIAFELDTFYVFEELPNMSFRSNMFKKCKKTITWSIVISIEDNYIDDYCNGEGLDAGELAEIESSFQLAIEEQWSEIKILPQIGDWISPKDSRHDIGQISARDFNANEKIINFEIN